VGAPGAGSEKASDADVTRAVKHGSVQVCLPVLGVLSPSSIGQLTNFGFDTGSDEFHSAHFSKNVSLLLKNMHCKAIMGLPLVIWHT